MPRTLNNKWREVLSDLALELAGGWYAAAVIVPNLAELTTSVNAMLLIVNFGLGTLLLVISYKLKP